MKNNTLDLCLNDDRGHSINEVVEIAINLVDKIGIETE